MAHLPYRLGLMLLMMSSTVQAENGSLSMAYQQGAAFAKSLQPQVIDAAQATSLDLISGATPTTQKDKPLPRYPANTLTPTAQAEAAHNAIAELVAKSYQQQSTLPPALTAEQLVKSQQASSEISGFCSDGSCANSQYQPSADFESALASLNVSAAASKDFTNNFIFTGYRKSCRVDGFAYNDCCRDKGWGQDIHMAGCSLSEQKLGLAKQAGSCHALGSYCDKRVLGVCVRHKESYCCFNAKLARIVQEQGRPQLGWGWGSAKHPNCQGFQVEQLQQLDFAKMDLQEFYTSIHQQMHLPNKAAMQARVQQRMGQNQADN